MRFFSIITASALAMAAHATPVNQTDATLVARGKCQLQTAAHLPMTASTVYIL